MTSKAITDGMANVAAGLGAANPKQGHGYVTHDSHALAELAYRGSTWFRRIVDAFAEDSTRAWRQWNASTDVISAMEKEERRLGLKRAVNAALVAREVFGGSLIVPIGLGTKPDKPLNLRTVGKGAIKSLVVLNRYQVTAGPPITDIESPYFGQPEYYEVASGTSAAVRYHPSRVARFTSLTMQGLTTLNDGWGDSLWTRISDAVQNSETGATVLSELMLEAKVDIIKMPDLAANMATEKDEQALIRRMTISNSIKSINNALLLDGSDEYEQKQVNFAGLPDVAMTLLKIMCGAAGMPETRLLGAQAKGLSNGGDADLKNYYDSVNARQELHMDPALKPLDDIIMMSALGKEEPDLWHKWSPLYAMTAKEVAEVEKAYAEAVDKIAATGLIPPDALAAAVADRMINSGAWPALEDAMDEAAMEANALKENSEPDPEADPFAEEPQEGEGQEGEPLPRAVNDAEPRTLYVRRDVINASAIKAWASSTLGDIIDLKEEGHHVTLIYSKQALDWAKVGEDWNGRDDGRLIVGAGGMRLVEGLGADGRTITLLFASSALTWRNHQFIEAGASSDWDDYQPHITLGTLKEGAELPQWVEPYKGEIILGVEVFEEVKA